MLITSKVGDVDESRIEVGLGSGCLLTKRCGRVLSLSQCGGQRFLLLALDAEAGFGRRDRRVQFRQFFVAGDDGVAERPASRRLLARTRRRGGPRPL